MQDSFSHIFHICEIRIKAEKINCRIYIAKREVKIIKYVICSRRPKFTVRQRVVLFRQLALILNSGLALLQGLELIEKRADKDTGIICRSLKRCLVRGSSLADAMKENKEFFSQLAIALTVVGEESGRLSEVLEELADYYSKQEEIKSVIVKASLYPLFLIVVSLVVLGFFLGYVLPILGNAYLSLQVRPQGLLSLFLGFSESGFASAEVFLIGLLTIGVLTLYERKGLCEHILAFAPVWSLYKKLLELRFCKLLSLMLSSGVDITKAVELCEDALGHNRAHCIVRLFNQRLQRGMDIGSAVSGCDSFFSPVTIELITVGAATGYLPAMLAEAANLGEQELRSKIDKLRELLAPCLLLVAALVTGAVVCSVVEPLFSLIGQIS